MWLALVVCGRRRVLQGGDLLLLSINLRFELGDRVADSLQEHFIVRGVALRAFEQSAEVGQLVR